MCDWWRPTNKPRTDGFARLIPSSSSVVVSRLQSLFQHRLHDAGQTFTVIWVAVTKDSGHYTKVELRVPVDTPKAANGRFIAYKMRDDKGFYEALLANHGIEKDCVEWKDYEDHDIFIYPRGPRARDVNEKQPNRFTTGPIWPCETHAGFAMHKN
ncbi:killer toxin subunits alpha beta [Fusarium tjaetaba]|uniref:Killer toxin subunits alpha beta n=1 Tax=Fusarium tjaetaba TaxID=1567544 RepID=A0A8H5VS70_9HYPO|nr:killer toxin subunits alpha beta [Fusarium tjaetaba]KAF5633646.1 killer toxin subunits alpha beta [Fusarium tjaetaba]